MPAIAVQVENLVRVCEGGELGFTVPSLRR
jgi:hypothetical protein